jgi:hypothetical protein
LFERLEILRQAQLRHNDAELALLTRIQTMLEQVQSAVINGAPDAPTESLESHKAAGIAPKRKNS